MRSFRELFRGCADQYGLYTINPSTKVVRDDGKVEGDRRTYGPEVKIKENDFKGDPALTDAEYEQHIDPASDKRLGVKPIQEDGSAVWFAIDIDIYSDEDLHLKFFDRLEELQIPMLITSSKSGGVHIWGFLTEAAPVKRVHAVLHKIAAALPAPRGHHDLFPSNPRGGGTWIHLPYFRSNECQGFNGRGWDHFDTFVEGANENALSIDDWERLTANIVRSAKAAKEPAKKESKPKADKADKRSEKGSKSAPDGDNPMFPDAPPCVNLMLTEGLDQGGRNNKMTHIGVYLMRSNEDWQQALMDINEEYCQPPLDFKEMRLIIGSLERNEGEIKYFCKHPDIEPFCHKQVCFTREFGVGSGESLFTNFQVLGCVRWIGQGRETRWDLTVDFEGKTHVIELKANDLLSPQLFKAAFLKAVSHLPSIPIKRHEFEEWLIKNINANREDRQYPEFMISGRKIEHVLTTWVETRTRNADTLETAINIHTPFYDQERKVLVFNGDDLKRQIDTTYGRFHDIADQEIVATLLANRYENKPLKLGNKSYEVWEFKIDQPWFPVYTKEQERKF